jgi:hypothetical protein
VDRTSPASKRPTGTVRIAYETPLGHMFLGMAEDALASREMRRWRGRVQMVFTSPPFPLRRQKKYGNRVGDDYADWLAKFARPLVEYLTPDGSIVIEVGNGWNPGTPTMSTTSL